MKRIPILLFLFLSVGTGLAAEEWKQYHKDATTTAYYKDVKIVSDEIREVTDSLQIGGACAINVYQANCKTKQWKQVQRGAGPCDRSIELQTGNLNWFSLDKKQINAKQMQKLMKIVCSN